MSISPAGRQFLGEKPPLSLRVLKRARPERRAARREAREAVPAADRALFEKLRANRLELAKAANVPPYVIFHDKTLVRLDAAAFGSPVLDPRRMPADDQTGASPRLRKVDARRRCGIVIHTRRGDTAFEARHAFPATAFCESIAPCESVARIGPGTVHLKTITHIRAAPHSA